MKTTIYSLSDKQKKAYQALIKSLKSDKTISTDDTEIRKALSTIKATAFEKKVYTNRRKLANKVLQKFEKSASFSKKHKRNWNSIPTDENIIEKFNNKVQIKLDKLAEKQEACLLSINQERLKRHDTGLLKLQKEISIAKEQSRKTQKKIFLEESYLKIESLLVSKIKQFNIEDFNLEYYVKDAKSDLSKLMSANKSLFLSFHFDSQERTDLRKCGVDMRPTNVMLFECYQRDDYKFIKTKKATEMIEEISKNDHRSSNFYKRLKKALMPIKNHLKDDYIAGALDSGYKVGHDYYDHTEGNPSQLMVLHDFGTHKEHVSYAAETTIPKGYLISVSVDFYFLPLYQINTLKQYLPKVSKKALTLASNLKKLQAESDKLKLKILSF